MALSVPLFIVTLFYCLKVIDSAPMAFWPHPNAYAARCDKHGNRCTRDRDCWCGNEDLRCIFVYLKGRKECTLANVNEIAMFYSSTAPPLTTPEMCFKYQHQCYHDNDCECEYLYCKQLSMDMKGLCLTQGEDLPSWFTPFSPTFKPSTTTSPKPVTTPTSPATTTGWHCENLGARCVEDTDCLCEHYDELWCTYVPEMHDHYCTPKKWDPTDHPPTSPRGTQPPPITGGCEMFAFSCSSDFDCFCEESDNLRCVYVHEEKEHFCLPDDWNERGPPTHEHLPITTKHALPTTTPLPTSNTRPFTLNTNLVPTKEGARDKPMSISERPWNPSKLGTSVPDDGNGYGGGPYTETLPITKSPWNLWGTKTIFGKKKGDHITLISSKKLTLNVPVKSLQEVINELDKKKLLK